MNLYGRNYNRLKKYHSIILTTCLFYTCLCLQVFAAETDTGDNLKNNTFVVEDASKDNVPDKDDNETGESTIIISADRIEKSSRDISLPSAVVTDEDIKEKVYTSMADLLESTPGFTISIITLVPCNGATMILLYHNLIAASIAGTIVMSVGMGIVISLAGYIAYVGRETFFTRSSKTRQGLQDYPLFRIYPHI